MTARGGAMRTSRTNASVRLAVNGQAVDATPDAKGYIAIRRVWQRGDVLQMDLPMPMRFWQSHPKVRDNRGRIALSRGPLLYCVERADMPGVDLDELCVDPQRIEAEWREEPLGGVVVLRGRRNVAKLIHAGRGRFTGH